MNKTLVHIKGMHCRSCEILVEDELMKVDGITCAKVDQKKGIAEIYHNSAHLDKTDVVKAVENAGYSIGKDERPWFSKNLGDYIDLAVCGVIILMVYYVANDLGLFKFSVSSVGGYTSLWIVLLIGLTAGISTCMALVGGLVLAASARFAEKHPYAGSAQKFRPHIFFNLGRILSYFILGGALGFAGSFFQLSPLTLGVLTIAVGIVMLVLGLQLTELFPRLTGMSFTLPKGLSQALGIKEHGQKEYSDKNSAIMGAFTFFLPCGFTQAMQLYAISSGSIMTGALTMGVFALGTAPGLLGIGGLTSVIKGAMAKSFFKFAGIVVIALAFFNMSNGYNLTGLGSSFLSFNTTANAQISDPNVTIENGVQIVRMTQDGGGYKPNSFTIKKGVPVKWIINSVDPYTCASTIVSQKLNIRQGLQQGENIIEFTPQETGSIAFTCIMGMYRGVFNVVDQNNANTANPGVVLAAKPPSQGSGSCGGKGGCGCGGARQKQVKAGDPLGTAPALTAAPTSIPQQAENTNIGGKNIQLIKAIYTQREDIQPNRFSVNVGMPVRLEIDAKEDGYGCMGSMALPGLSQKIDVFTSGKTMVFDFTPSKTGKYDMTCAMGVPRGSIEVI